MTCAPPRINGALVSAASEAISGADCFWVLLQSAAPDFPKARILKGKAMKIRNSLKSLKNRHRDCRVIRRRGRTYVINKTNRRFKARQG